MRRLGLFIAFSLGFHALLLGIITRPERVAPASVPEPLRIRIQTRAERPDPMAGVEPSPGPAKAPAKPVAKAPVKTPGHRPVETPSAIKSYADLFPKAGEVPSPEAPAAALGRGAPVFDPEGESFAFAVQTKSLARLEGFGRELAARIDVPFGVKRLQSSGRAFVRINRDGRGGWRVMTASGEPFFRAILYEVLAEVPAGSFLATLLNDTEYPSVRIYFDLAAVSSLDLTAKPVVVRTASNKVFLDFTHGRPDPAWQNIMAIDNPEGNDAIGWNMIGTGMYAWQKYHERDPNDDPDVRKLRLSPAFARPIGR